MGLLSRFRMLFRMKANAALDRVEQPGQVVDYAFAQQQELLRQVKQGLIEVATAKRRLERQSQKLSGRVPALEDRTRRALEAGREDLARLSVQRKQAVAAELEGLESQIAEVAEEESKLTIAEQKLATRVEEFRTRRDVMSGRYSAAQAQVRAGEAITGVSGELAELTRALGRAEEKTDRLQARAYAIDELIDSGALALPGEDAEVVERELREITVEVELASIKAELSQQKQAPALTDGDSKGEQRES